MVGHGSGGFELEAGGRELDEPRRGGLFEVLGHGLAGGDPGDREAEARRGLRDVGCAVDLVELRVEQTRRRERAVALGELVDEIGGGTASGRPVRVVQVGGPLGAYFPRALFDTPFDYEAFAARDGLIGHGGIVVFDDTVDMARQARFAMEFCAIESCGKCTPCRIGSTRGTEVIDRIIGGEDAAANLALVEELCTTMKFGSLCALGGFTPYPVMSALTHLPEDFGASPRLEAAE